MEASELSGSATVRGARFSFGRPVVSAGQVFQLVRAIDSLPIVGAGNYKFIHQFIVNNILKRKLENHSVRENETTNPCWISYNPIAGFGFGYFFKLLAKAERMDSCM